MGYSPTFLLVIISTTLLLSLDSLLAHTTSHHNGPITNVTKHLHFPTFNPNKNPTIIQDIKLLGSSKISKDQNSIQIPYASPTIDLKYQAGRAIYSSPVRLFDPLSHTPASFQTTFSFQILATAAAPEGGSSGGGLAFVIVPDEFTVGRPGPWLGMLNDACDNHYKTVAVEFDTCHDKDYDDPNNNHVGLNLGSIISTQTAPASEVNVSLNDGSVHRAWIQYDSIHMWLNVHLGSDGGDFPSKPILSVHLDLSPYLKQEYMFIGFSASTGNTSQVHSILSWTFTSTVQAFLRVPSTRTCKQNLALQELKYSKNAHKKPPTSFKIFVAIMGLITLTLLNLCCNYKPRNSSTTFIIPEKKQIPLRPTIARRYTISEICRATRSFSESEVLGIDSRGVLYRGTLLNGCCLAMKRFSIELENRRILKLINLVMSQTSHPNLGQIRGWCLINGETIVVYDYFQNGSLDRWLLGFGFLQWDRRFKIVKEIAEALNHLHSKEIIHGFLKTSSVFIDMNYRAILSDYGFVVSSRVEEFNEFKRRDVFDFGVLVLEIIGVKKRLEAERGEEDVGIVGLARRAHDRGETNGLFDQRMGSCVESEDAIRVLQIALICSLDESNGRPSMEEVVQFLNMEKPVPISR